MESTEISEMKLRIKWNNEIASFSTQNWSINDREVYFFEVIDQK